MREGFLRKIAVKQNLKNSTQLKREIKGLKKIKKKSGRADNRPKNHLSEKTSSLKKSQKADVTKKPVQKTVRITLQKNSLKRLNQTALMPEK